MTLDLPRPANFGREGKRPNLRRGYPGLPKAHKC